MTTLKSENDVLDWISEEIQDLVLDTATQLYNGVVSRTPVQTGQLRASWTMTKSHQDFSTIDEGEGLGPPVAPKLKFKPGEWPVIFISNGKPYAAYVEYGTSKMAPRGMLAATMASL